VLDTEDSPEVTRVARSPSWRKRFWALLRQRCPVCCRGPIFKGRYAMNRHCPVCGLDFEPEGGYFLGAMYFSYLLAIVVLGTFTFALHALLPDWDLQWLVLPALVPFLFTVPLLFRYSRVLWIYFDRWGSGDL
jgi:uncharacterized protein (DUF983 family)